MNVVLMYGGKSSEHEVSLVSCCAVARNISAKHNVKLISVSKEGKWYLQDDSVFEKIRSDATATLSINADPSRLVSVIPGGGTNSAFKCGNATIPCDAVFAVMHGTYSEDGTLQGLFEMMGIPYVGCGVLSSAATMDKETTKILWNNAGLPIVPYVCLTKSDVNNSDVYDEKIKEAIEKLGLPIFVKPCSAGSSVGASKADNEQELSEALKEAFRWDNKVLLEKTINAREVECSVTGNSITQDPSEPCTMLASYGPGEIVPKHEFYDYDAKYNDPNGADLEIPALLPADKLSYIRETAKKAFRAVNASGLSRVDFFIDRDTDEIYLNEINTLPGFTSISMFPKMCASEGLDFTSLIDFLFDEAIAAHKAKTTLSTSRI